MTADRSVIANPESEELPADRSRATSAPFWTWFNVLSIDAVLVGLVWQLVFCVAFLHRVPRLYEFTCIGLSVWLVYTADRLFDSFKLDITRAHTLRHHFHYRYRKLIAACWFFILAINTATIATNATEAQLRWGCVAIAVAVAYVTGAQVYGQKSALLPKEFQVGLVFAFGVSLTVWSDSAKTDIVSLAVAALMTAWLFAANCVAIANLESHLDRNQDFASLALRHPAAARQLSWLIAIHLALVVALFAMNLVPTLVAACLFASDLLLILVSIAFNGRCDTNTECGHTPQINPRVVLADLALAVPPLVWFCFGQSFQ